MEIFRQITANNIALKEYPFLKELAMEAYLLENEEILKLDAGNFNEVAVLDAEIALKSGRKTSDKDGRIDILARYGMDYLAIVELKLHEINEDTLSQLEDYLAEKDQLLRKHPEFWPDSETPPQWIGVMVGNSIAPELQRKLQEGYRTESGIPIAGMVIRRFRGQTNEIYVISDTFFKYNYTNRDFSLFRFKGGLYNKPKLVNQVVKSYIEKYPATTYAELKQVLPDRLQGSLGVFTNQEDAQELLERTGHKRYYLKAHELVELSDATISTCTQWGIGNVKSFIDHVNKLGPDFRIEID